MIIRDTAMYRATWDSRVSLVSRLARARISSPSVVLDCEPGERIFLASGGRSFNLGRLVVMRMSLKLC